MNMTKEWLIGGDHDIGSGGITKTGGRTSEDISDGSGWVIEDPTDTINGDDQYDAATEYGGRTKEWLGGWDARGDTNIPKHEVPKHGGEGLDHEWYIEGDYGFSGDLGLSGVWDKQDPTWMSGHTNSFSDTTGL